LKEFGSPLTPNDGGNLTPAKSKQVSWGILRSRLKSVIVGSNPNDNQAPLQAKTWVMREGASLNEKAMMLFWVPGVRDSDREFVASCGRALDGHAAILPDGSQGPSIGAIYDILLSGVTPSSDAYAIVKGHTRCGGFTLRADHGGNAVQLIVFATDADGNRHLLGNKSGTVFQCRGSRVWHRYPTDYEAAIKVITASVNHGAIYVRAASGGWPKNLFEQVI
jgi:hypothetical protein